MSELGLTVEQNKVLRRLRSPSSRTALIAFGYAREGRTNPGLTLRFAPGEQAVAPGDGKVVAVVQKFADWFHTTPSDLDSLFTYEVTLDHGSNVLTVVSGLRSLAHGINRGQTVSRGDTLGPLVSDECFFQVAVNRTLCNPQLINRHFKPLDGQYVPGQERHLRGTPDFLARDLSQGLRQVMVGGLRYFENTREGLKLRLNVDFNGDGNKTGEAVVGQPGDYWNVYEAGTFAATAVVAACTGTTYNKSPQTWLYDWNQAKSPVWLERTATATAAHGSSAWFDPMLSTFIGGTLEENFFALRGLPNGNYALYLYANEAGSSFDVAVDAGPPQTGTTASTVTPAFVENLNFASFSVTVDPGSSVSVKATGALAGLQLIRV